eukprot:m51a1_g14244 hypothetical protein (117) ;mRNA; f:244621-244971
MQGALASPYNWSYMPCTLLLHNATHPPPGTLVVGVLHTGKTAANLEARRAARAPPSPAIPSYTARYPLPQIVMSVCLALTEASEARAFGSYNVSIVLFDDLGLNVSPELTAQFRDT